VQVKIDQRNSSVDAVAVVDAVDAVSYVDVTVELQFRFKEYFI
jgi:hypothetical protein